MPVCDEKGEVTLIKRGKELDVEWQIPDFLSLSKDKNIFFWSPTISFEDEDWYIVLWPNGSEDWDTVGYIHLRLWRRSSNGPPMNVEFTFALKSTSGQKHFVKLRTEDFKENSCRDIIQFLSKSDFEKSQTQFLASGTLTIICTLKRVKSTGSASTNTEEKCCYCEETLDAEFVSSHKNCMHNTTKSADISGDFPLKTDLDGNGCQMKGTEASKKILNDLKELMQNGIHSDTVIKVKGEEFRLHRNILAVRNPYFHSMFNSDMKEKTTGIVSIDDCNPDTFRSLIHFIYTGTVDKLSLENVCGLYEAADKYQEDQLKEECLHFMMNSMCVDILCDCLVLALRHDEKNLLQKATEFFCSKAKEILRHVKWQTFLAEYPTQANELYIKALDKSDDK